MLSAVAVRSPVAAVLAVLLVAAVPAAPGAHAAMPAAPRSLTPAAAAPRALAATADADSWPVHGQPPPSYGPPAVPYVLPVSDPIIRSYDAPDDPYAPGHRGIDFDVEPGAPVAAAAGGVVRWAGDVVGTLWVSIDHPDGVITSYGPLERPLVDRGDRVASGQVIGIAAGDAHDRGGLHWGARRNGSGYFDPAWLLQPWTPSLVGPGGWTGVDVPDIGYGPWSGDRNWLGLVPESPEATERGWVFAPNPNHVIGVAGLGSDTEHPPIDLLHLGYRTEDVTYLSYAGRDDGWDGDGPLRDQLPYGPDDTWRGIRPAAERLRDQLRAQWRRNPGQAVDLLGHSMGGVVIMYYLLHLHDPTDPTLPPIDHVVTIASPLEGADLATGLAEIQKSPGGTAVLALLSGLVADHDANSQAIRDLAVTSDVIASLRARWRAAVADLRSGPLALGTEVLTLGGQQDLVVPEQRSNLPGADHVVLPGTHDSVRDTEASRIVVRAFLAGQPVPGESGGIAHVASYLVSHLEDTLGRIGSLLTTDGLSLLLP